MSAGTSRQKRAFEATLIWRFTLIGIGVTTIAAVVIGYFFQQRLVSQELQEAAGIASRQVSTLIRPLLDAKSMEGAFSPELYRQVDATVRTSLSQPEDIVRVKIWNNEMTLLYSDLGQNLGEREPDNGELLAALHGAVHAELSSLGKAENTTEYGAFSHLLEVYVPLRASGSEEIVGAYEIYASTARLDARIAEIRINVVVGVVGGFGLLYLALFGVVAQASRRLVGQAVENERLARQVTDAWDETLEGWAKALELRDAETEGHCRRTTGMTLLVAEELGLFGTELDDARRGALLHDIGKMGVPDAILLKPGPLTGEETEIMHRHPEFARHVLQDISYLGRAIDIPYCHHEKWDGSGYPRGLAGAQIPLSARIFSVVDAWDALASNRPYRAAWPAVRIREYLTAQAGKQYDPAVVDVFLRLLDRQTSATELPP